MIKKSLHHVHKHKTTYGKFIVTGLLCIAFILFLLGGESILPPIQKQSNEVQEVSHITPLIHRGSLTIKIENTSIVSIGSVIPLTVIGSSDNQPVAGYDVVLSYDSHKLQFARVASLDSRFMIFTDVTDNRISITGVQKETRGINPVLTDTNMLELQFKAVGTGAAAFHIQYQPGSKTDSNLMNTKNEDILGSVEGTVIEITK